MKRSFWFIGSGALLLTACEPIQSGGSSNYIEAPQAVIDVAGPNQNLKAVRINPADGCYVYRYVGPVETTYLPLKTANERPICTRAPEPATTG
ncbi:MAG: hypothetical protein AB8B94_18095 [Hyphomicrobiales bacterium]